MNKQTRETLIKLALLSVIFMSCIVVSVSETAFASEWSKWSSPKQATFYTELYASASGISLTKHDCVAVDMSKVVSKKKWKKGNSKFKRTHWYYGQKIQVKHYLKNRKPVTLTVADCGSFGWAGQYYKGKWRNRIYDIAGYPLAKRIGITWNEGVGLIKWRYKK